MKIGILSMHRIINHGSFLQAFVLKKVVEAYGNEVEFIDYKPGEMCFAHNIKGKTLFERMRYLPQKIKGRLISKKNTYNFINIYQKDLNIKQEKNYNSKYDMVIIGSDEVFNFVQDSSIGFVPEFFGLKIDADIIISYAASAGYSNYDDALKYNVLSKIESGLRSFKAISVRDDNTENFIEAVLHHKPIRVIDPTFLINLKDIIAPCHSIKASKFILIYAYPGRMNDKNEVKAIKEFARKNKCVLVAAGFFQPWCDINIMPSPYEILDVFNRAAYVITDTFHGSIISINLNKDFVTFVRAKTGSLNNGNKIYSVLREFSLTNRIVESPDKLSKVMARNIDYKKVNVILNKRRNDSLKFIENWCKEKSLLDYLEQSSSN